MLHTSARTLKVLAALVWYTGGVVLIVKGAALLLEANALRPDQVWRWLSIVLGLLVGGLRAKFLFARVCRKNLARIAALEDPRIWQFFRPGFLVFLALMIAGGAMLSRMAHNNYPFLIAVAILDLSIAIALIGGSYPFWAGEPPRNDSLEVEPC